MLLKANNYLRKKGLFHLTAKDASLGVGEARVSSCDLSASGSSSASQGGVGANPPLWLATPQQLANRVVIRWFNGALDRRAAMAEVLAGAAAIQAQQGQA